MFVWSKKAVVVAVNTAILGNLDWLYFSFFCFF